MIDNTPAGEVRGTQTRLAAPTPTPPGPHSDDLEPTGAMCSNAMMKTHSWPPDAAAVNTGSGSRRDRAAAVAASSSTIGSPASAAVAACDPGVCAAAPWGPTRLLSNPAMCFIPDRCV
jgi:hypothetical protein